MGSGGVCFEFGALVGEGCGSIGRGWSGRGRVCGRVWREKGVIGGGVEDEGLAVLSESACCGGGGDVGLEGGGFQSGKGGFHLVLHGAYGGAEEGGHGVCPGHLLENSDEETDLNLG